MTGTLLRRVKLGPPVQLPTNDDSRRSRVRRCANELKTGPMGFNSSTNPMIHGAAHERCPVERRMASPRHGHWTRFRIEGSSQSHCPTREILARRWRIGRNRDESSNRGNFQLRNTVTAILFWEILFSFFFFQFSSKRWGKVFERFFFLYRNRFVAWKIKLDPFHGASKGFRLISGNWKA